MKQTLQTPAFPAKALQSFLARRPVRFTLRFCGAFFGGFALACLGVGRRTLPAAACLTAAFTGTPAVAAVLGAIAGYFTLFPFLEALEPSASAVMICTLAAILRQSDLPETPRTLPLLSFCATCSIGLIYAVGAGGPALLLLVLRCAIAVGCTVFYQRLLPKVQQETPPLPQRKEQAVQALRVADRLLQTEAQAHAPGSVTALYDSVTDQVCLRCTRYHNCFELKGDETYRDLRRASEAFLPRGTASAADFPESFLRRCRQTDGLVAAINHELTGRLTRLQTSRRLTEYRTVLSGHYRLLSELLSDRSPLRAKGETRFAPELGVRALGRHGARISGDRGASFVQSGILYLLLCDGMGTGPDAAQEAKGAIALLGSLLKAGARPEEALQLLNGVYILRGGVSFTTVDLLQLDLSSGTGELFKWGAAPSYLLRGRSMKKIGTASPPPGADAPESGGPERMRLSLQRGETLVLLSDGIDAARAEAYLSVCGGEAPQQIAAEVIAQQAADGEDDMSAVVLRLCPDEVS